VLQLLLTDKIDFGDYIGNLNRDKITNLMSLFFKDVHELVKRKQHHIAYMYKFYIDYIERLIRLCEFAGIEDEETVKNAKYYLSQLEKPIRERKAKVLKEKDFFDYFKKLEENLIRLTITILETIEKRIGKLSISSLDWICCDWIEIVRLNEAIHCYFEKKFYASVVMLACVVERRLFYLMSQVRSDKREYLEDLTLGQLIREYLNNKDDYKRIIPKRHEKLLELINDYRILSAHPKDEELKEALVRSLLTMVFDFLIDTRAKIKD